MSQIQVLVNRTTIKTHMAYKTTSQTIHDFDFIFSLIGRNDDFAADPKNPFVKRLSQKYFINPVQIIILAYLLHYHGEEILGRKIKRIFKDTDAASRAMADLVERGFVRPRDMLDVEFNFCYRVSEDAYKAFSTDKPFKEKGFDDCMNEIMSCTAADIYQPSWLGMFNRSLYKEKGCQLKEAFDMLHIDELSDKQQRAFWATANYFAHNFDKALDFNLDDVDVEIYEHLKDFIKMGLVDITTVESDSKVYKEYHLSVKVAGLLFKGHDELIRYDELSKYANIVKCNSITKKEMFFTAKAGEEVEKLKTMLSKEGFNRAKAILERQKRPASIISLLWGPPGTGKTETARQLAFETGRDLVLFELSKVTGYGWGTTEKCYRALFRAYKYIAAISDCVPILLLNEADSILCKRLLRMDHAIDKSENIVTNILLEEMENMNGILLATTNLIDNMDEAFYRRFLFKTKMEKPDATARKMIWKSLIPELSEADARELATTFEMSGAQIDNVVTKRNLAELYYEGDRGLKYIKGLCTEELATENGSKSARVRIGF